MVVIRRGESAGRKDNLEHVPRCMRECRSGSAERSVSEILGVLRGKNIGGCGARVEEAGGPEGEGQIKQILSHLSQDFSVISNESSALASHLNESSALVKIGQFREEGLFT